MREKTSSCLIQQRWPYSILCAVSQLEASEQTGKEGVREEGETVKRGNRPGRKKGGATHSNRSGINSEKTR